MPSPCHLQTHNIVNRCFLRVVHLNDIKHRLHVWSWSRDDQYQCRQGGAGVGSVGRCYFTDYAHNLNLHE